MAIEEIRKALHGISGIHVTPYDDAGAVDLQLLKAVVDDMTNAGVHNIVSGGNTGEFFALAVDEILALQIAAVEAVNGRAVATAAIGRSLPEARAMARAAKHAGFNSVMAHHPLDPFAAPRAQAAYFLDLAEASELPLVAYVRSDLISADDLARVAAHQNVAGIKFASTNLMLLAQCIRATLSYPCIWVCGLAEGWAVPFYAMGARGFTSGLVNVYPAQSLAIWSALERSDFTTARTLVDQIAPFETMRTKFNNGANVTVVKEAMRLLGRRVGAVRRPGLPELDVSDRAALATILAGWGLGQDGTRP